MVYLPAQKLIVIEQLVLVITDIVMPGKNGRVLILDSMKNEDKTPIIAISDGGITDCFGHLREPKIGTRRILNKPFTA